MSKTSIEWASMTWNPTTGCDKVSAGCKNCYAAVLSKRLRAMGQKKYKDNFKLTMHPSEITRPNTWKKPKVVFVNSMSDLLHKDVSDDFIKLLFKKMNDTPQHIYQVLTKRPERIAEISSELTWSDNIWMGTSIEDGRVMERLDYLKQCGAKIKFLSLEPLIGPLPKMDLTEIDWAIVGGESGPGARPIEEKWVLDIRDQCHEQSVKFFLKQWGGVRKKLKGRLLEGKEYNEMPDVFAQHLIATKINLSQPLKNL